MQCLCLKVHTPGMSPSSSTSLVFGVHVHVQLFSSAYEQHPPLSLANNSTQSGDLASVTRVFWMCNATSLVWSLKQSLHISWHRRLCCGLPPPSLKYLPMQLFIHSPVCVPQAAPWGGQCTHQMSCQTSMKTAHSDSAQLRQFEAAMKGLICVRYCRWGLSSNKGHHTTQWGDLWSLHSQQLVSWSQSCTILDVWTGMKSSCRFSPRQAMGDIQNSLFCLALIIAPCLQDHCPSVKLDWKRTDGLVVSGVGKWHTWALC